MGCPVSDLGSNQKPDITPVLANRPVLPHAGVTMDNQMAVWTPDTRMGDGDAYSATSAADLLGVSQRTIRRAIAGGELPALKFAGVYRISPADLEHYRSARRRPISPRPLTPRRTPRLLRFPERASAHLSELPRPLTSLIGRETEVAAVVDLVVRGDVPLVTLTGPGGVGKTRLALRVVEALQAGPDFPDGVWFIDLAPLSDPDLVVVSIARGLGVRGSNGRAPLEALRLHMRGRTLLIVLDNFEHLLDGASDLVELLAGCRGLTLLVTSRTLLRISGERDFPVPPLQLPPRGNHHLKDGLGAVAAVRLFVERAQAVRPEFMVTDENAAAVAEICHRLDGMPLALELAAAHSNLFSPQTLLARLDRTLPMLTGGARDLPPRLQTMRAAIAWSFALLSPGQQQLFRRLAVFAGSFTLEAVQTVCAAANQPESEVLATFSALVDSSLLQREEDSDGESRFRMLETIREFSLEQLTDCGEELTVRAAHAAWYFELATRLAPDLVSQHVQPALAKLERDYPNLRAALAHFASCDDGERLLQLAVSLANFWEPSGRWNDAITWLERGLDTNCVPSANGVAALESLGLIVGNQGDIARAESILQRALDLTDDLELIQPRALVLCSLARLLIGQGRYEEAEALCDESVRLFQLADNQDEEGLAQTQAGIAAWGRGDRVRARGHFARAMAIWEEMGNPLPLGLPVRHLALMSLEDGDLAQATRFYRQFLDHAPKSEYTFARALPDLASILAPVAAEQAAELYGAGSQLAEAMGFVMSLPHCRVHQRAMMVARRTLGSGRFDNAFNRGKARPRPDFESLVAAALDVVSPCPAEGETAIARSALTTREREIARLLAERYTDREIAEALFIARRTASNHVASIIAKLGVHDRRAAGAEAIRLGLI